jgi:hypothetical protein
MFLLRHDECCDVWLNSSLCGLILIMLGPLLFIGDLTAYFHPSEKNAYDLIYKDIQGLNNYFPSLG